MIKKINVYLLIKVLFILVALSLIVIIRADYHQDTRDIIDELINYFTPLTIDYIVIRLLSFGVLFAVCFDLEAAMERRMHLTKKRFIVSIILLLVSLIDYYKLFVFQNWSWNMGITYFISTRYLTLVVSALAGSLCCGSFKTE
jgi:hypothetical protein